MPGLVSQEDFVLDDKFRFLVEELLEKYDAECGLGYMSTNAYDTAWVACIRSQDGLQLVPEALQSLLSMQDEDGAWSTGADCGSQILSSLAGLYALTHCQKNFSIDLAERIRKARSQLESWLRTFTDIGEGGVGFEVIAPCLLNLLAAEGIVLDFPAKNQLLARQKAKLQKVPREVLYEKSTPLLHSLEAFFDDPTVNYDRFAKHKTDGSMMASPSSTAAYLMRATKWDNEAEAYIKRVVKYGSGRGSGAVPSAFPTTVFETTWVLSTTLSAGFDFSAVSQCSRENLSKIHTDSGAAKRECVAFAPGLEPDLDDTAKMSITAELTGLSQITSPMVERFEVNTHMQTYKLERNPSCSANSNALLALLHGFRLKSRESTVEKVTSFLCDAWAESNTLPKDKWNVSPYYTPMLIAEAFVRLVIEDDQQVLSGELHVQVLQVLIQYAIRILQTQRPDGSWGDIGPREETAYAVIGLAHISRLHQLASLLPQIHDAVKHGRHFLKSQLEGPPEYLWVEKVLYGSRVLSTAYILSALKIELASPFNQGVGDDFLLAMKIDPAVKRAPPKEKDQSLKLLAKLPMLQGCPSWVLKASAIEAQTFLPALRRIRDRLFDRKGFTEDKYFEWIPVIWAVANNSLGGPMSPSAMMNMMAISVINFQVDEFMESIAAESVDFEVSAWIQSLVGEGYGAKTASTNSETSKNGSQITEHLRAYIEYVWSQPKVQQASTHDRKLLLSELSKFLLAHLAQNNDNAEFARQNRGNSEEQASSTRVFQSPRNNFQSWVRGTAAQHTSCPYSFAYAACTLAQDGQDFFSTLPQKYMAEDICQHLATMCRLYNDAGSLRRDRTEWNLNGANFPELQAQDGEAHDSTTDRDRLLEIASYERSLMERAYEELKKIAPKHVMNMLDIFIRVTDMFGEIYILKDLASRKLENTHGNSTTLENWVSNTTTFQNGDSSGDISQNDGVNGIKIPTEVKVE